MQFHKFSEAISKEALRRGIYKLVFMLDDFWGYAPTRKRAMEDMWLFLKLLVELGISPKWSKVVMPCKVIKFLGITIDLVRMVVCLDKDKVTKYRDLLNKVSVANGLTVKDIRSVCGVLNHVAVVIPCLKPWLRAGLDMLKGKPRSMDGVVVPPHFKEDLGFIRNVLMIQHNKRMLESHMSRWVVPMELESDASTSTGWGWCWLHNGMCHKAVWEGAQADWHINVMELFAVWQALTVIAPMCVNAIVPVVVDNQVARGWLRKASADCWEATFMLREVAQLLLQHNMVLRVRWVRSEDNPRADALSRNDMHKLMQSWSSQYPNIVWV